jgi:crotonobetainyl-CoA:carnitine CoA-transferase CaiB-like acyl-CoA transferase
MSAVLKGVRVIDFGRYIAGPYCGALLAEYGADVIRMAAKTAFPLRWAVAWVPSFCR